MPVGTSATIQRQLQPKPLTTTPQQTRIDPPRRLISRPQTASSVTAATKTVQTIKPMLADLIVTAPFVLGGRVLPTILSTRAHAGAAGGVQTKELDAASATVATLLAQLFKHQTLAATQPQTTTIGAASLRTLQTGFQVALPPVAYGTSPVAVITAKLVPHPVLAATSATVASAGRAIASRLTAGSVTVAAVAKKPGHALATSAPGLAQIAAQKVAKVAALLATQGQAATAARSLAITEQTTQDQSATSNVVLTTSLTATNGTAATQGARQLAVVRAATVRGATTVVKSSAHLLRAAAATVANLLGAGPAVTPVNDGSTTDLLKNPQGRSIISGSPSRSRTRLGDK